MSDEQRNTVWRFAMIFIVIALGFVAVLAKIVYIQAVERDEWLKVAEKQVPTNRPIPATRGNILDCNGRLLASSMPQYYIYMDTRVPALHEKNGELFNKHIDTLALDLATIIGDKSAAEYKAKIVGAYRHGEKRLRVCENRINYLQRQALEQNKLIKKGKYKSGIFFEDQHRRIKPYGLLASRTIGGIYGEGGSGNSGLEKGFDKELRGVDGMSSIQNICIYSYPYVSQKVFNRGVYIALRDSFMGANIPGELEGSVMSTNRDFVTVENMQIQGHYVQEARGFWEMTKDVMGGPFVAHSQVDTINNRVIVVEGFVYAPDKMKRTMMRRLEAALYTLKLPGKEESEE